MYSTESAEQMFEEVALPLIDEVTNGFNACIFAYGATGSGKTFTMLGNDKIDGISKLCLKNVYSFIDKSEDYNFEIIVSYIEIYNEYIRDLLIEKKQQANYLDLRDDNEKGTVIAGVSEIKVENVSDIMQ